jgi:glycosyltransferase involved in cell wall biosynthesis
MNNPVAFILKGYPRLSETFIAQEILALEKRGLDLRLYSLRQPTDKRRHPIHDEISAVPNYLPEYLYQQPLRVVRAWLALRKQPGYLAARNIWLGDLRRDPSANRIRRFGQALVLAHELPADVGWIHAHFLHTPASVVRYGAHMRGLPWSCSAHAKDIWTSPEWELREKLDDCRWLVTCTRSNAEYLSRLAADPSRVELVYHGLDFSRFQAPENSSQDRNGKQVDKPVRLICVGRAVEKKGHAGFLAALAKLPKDLNWCLELVGGGELLPVLKKQAEQLGLSDRIIWAGALPQEEVLTRYRNSDLFVLNSRIAGDGDRDGLPNVLMEAQSQHLACLSTDVSGISELIEDQVTGILVRPDDDDALAENLKSLICYPDLRHKLAEAALQRVHEQFDFGQGIEQLAGRFNIGPTG